MASNDIATRGGVPLTIINLKEFIWVLLLETQADITEYAQRAKFTRAEAAHLAGCGVSAIKAAIIANELPVGPSGWITRPNLAAWLGHDPISARIDQLIALQRQALELAKTVERLLDETSQNQPEPAIDDADVQMAA